MPYRRLPNTDAARIRALKAALKKGQYLEKNGRRSKGKAVKATGMVAPQPFMRPAFEASKYRANDAIAQALGKAIEDAARKARW